MRTVFSYDRLAQIAARGMDLGGFMATRSTFSYNVAGRCEAPINLTLTGREGPEKRSIFQTRFTRSSERRDIDLTVRCGKCGPCLAQRAARWRYRAQDEVKGHARTWFVTLTLSPSAHFNMKLRASQRLRARCAEDFDQLPPQRQFQERHREIGIELTKWLKRVRKESGAPLRYCLVAEAHKSGLPHYHALIHECHEGSPVRARTLRKQWRLGFSQARLVAQGEETRHASYVAKYLSKSANARVRASQGYGHILPLKRASRIDTCKVRGFSDPLGGAGDPLTTTAGAVMKAVFDGLHPARGSHLWRDLVLNESECSEPSSFKPWEPIPREELRAASTRTVH